jgi:2-hydroxycyclohexanecarboxyl-CoA dehydrogenase
VNRLSERVVLVTGAARGIGRGIAAKCAAEGATVAVTDVDEVGAAAAAKEIGDAAFPVHLDVTSRQSVGQAVATVLERTGRIDVLVNNAGWDKAAPFLDSTPADWDRVLAISLLGPINVTHAVLPAMVSRKAGSVVNIASDAGRVGSSSEAVYSAAKGGVIAFTKTIAREMARHGINANCVCPGPAATDLFEEVTAGNEKLREGLIRAIPFRRLAEPADVANMVAFLASAEASYVTGQTVSVSGGLTMA